MHYKLNYKLICSIKSQTKMENNCEKDIPDLPHDFKNRVENKKYMLNGKIVICRGRVLFCKHNILRIYCEDKSCIELHTYCPHNIIIEHCSICKKIS